MQGYKITNAFSTNQKELLRRRLKEYKSENGYTLQNLAYYLNLAYWESKLLKHHVDKEISKRNSSKFTNIVNDEDILDQKDIIDRQQLQKFFGNIDQNTGIKKSYYPRNAELNIIAQFLYDKKYISNAQLDLIGNSNLGLAYSLAEYFKQQIDDELIDLKGDYVRYEINNQQIKQQILHIDLSQSNHFFVMTNILSIFANHDGIKNGENFKVQNYKNHCHSIDSKIGWASVIPKKALMGFLKNWDKPEEHECLLITDYHKNNDALHAIKTQNIPAIYNSAPSLTIKEYQLCDVEEFDKAGVFVKEYARKSLEDKQAEFYQDSKRSAVPKIAEDQDERDIKKPQFSLKLVFDNKENTSEQEKVMRDELGEKFVQSVYDWEQETYLDCIDQGVDVNYKSKESGMTAIHMAAKSGNYHAVDILRDHPKIDLLVFSEGGAWLPSDVAALVQNPSLADALGEAENKQMKERGITRPELVAEATRRIEEKAAPFKNTQPDGETLNDENIPS